MAIFLLLASSCAPDEPDKKWAESNAEIRRIEAASYQDEGRTTLDWCREMAVVDYDHPILLQFVVDRVYAEGGFDEVKTTIEACVGPESLLQKAVEGVGHLLAPDMDKAELTFGALRDSYAEREHLAGIGTASFNLGQLDRYSGRPGEAREHFATAADLQRRVGDDRNECLARAALGQLLLDAGELGLAAEQLRLAVELAPDVEQETRCANGRLVGSIQMRRGNFSSSWSSYTRAAEDCASIRPPEELDGILLRAASMAIKSGEFEPAQQSIDQILRRAEQREGGEFLSRVFEVRAEYWNATGRHADAKKDLRRASESLPADHPRQTQLTAKRGLALLHEGRFGAARREIESAVRGQPPGSAPPEWLSYAFNDLAVIARRTGEVAESIVHQHRALDLFEQSGEPWGVANSRHNLAMFYYSLGDFERAFAHAENAVVLSQETEDPVQQGFAFAGRAAVSGSLKQWEAAVADYRSALQLFSENGPHHARTLIGYALTLHGSGDTSEARRQVARGLKVARGLNRPEIEGFGLTVAGTIEDEEGNHAAAVDLLEQAVEVVESEQDLEPLTFARWKLAEALHHDGKLDQAEVSYRSAIELLERQRASMGGPEIRAGFHVDSVKLYESAIRLSVERGASPAVVFDLVESSRARTLRELLEESRQSLRSRLSQAEREEERALLDAVGEAAEELRRADRDNRATVTERMRAAEESLLGFQLKLRLGNPDYAAMAYPATVTLAELQEQLRPDEMVLEYFVGKDLAWRIDITRDSASVHDLPTPVEIEALAMSMARELRAPALAGGAAVRRSSQAASTLLPRYFGSDVKRLLVVPDGAAHRLPFEALRFGDRFLIESHEVAVLPSSTTLVDARARPNLRAAAGWLGLGAPSAESEEFPPLRYAERSLTSIAGEFEGNSRVLAGDDLDRSALEQEELSVFRFVHFATHAAIDSDNPAASGLLLSDDLLRLNDIFTLELDAELVSLSACESALGELLKGEGFISLTRAFLYAGSDSVLASLWKVNDKSTGDFMVRFYGYVADGMSVPAALRQTKIDFIHSDLPAYRDPYRWAPFVLIGHPSVGDTEPVAQRID